MSEDMETNLQKAQRINIQLLKEIDRVCEKYNLKYYLICGALLGAVRHHDLIPWDDDVDIAMPRKDYEKLKRIAETEWNNTDFCFVKYNELGKGTFLDFFSRLLYMKEKVPQQTFEKIKGKGRDDIQDCMALDIYVLDYASRNERIHFCKARFIQGLYGLAMGHRAYVDYEDFNNYPVEEKVRKIARTLSKIGRYIPLKFIFMIYELTCKLFSSSKSEEYFMSNCYIFCIPWKHKKEWFGNGTLVDIGEHKFKAPQNYDAYLKVQYGDYMQLPPEASRKPTHVIEE